MDRNAKLLLPEVNYFQVVFTLPDRLSRLVLGNRRELYQLLFRSAWRALKQELEKQNIDPAALLVLHTWNQELGHHPHIHALVPGAGPSLNQDNDPSWVTAGDATRPWRDKPSLVNNVDLGRTFRDKFVRGLGWLIRNETLELPHEWEMLKNPATLKRWLKSLKETDWNVFIEGPPHGKSDPEHVLKYLTRYMTGGPISDRRIQSDEAGKVTFLARCKSKQSKSKQSNSKQTATSKKSRRIELSGAEFVRRWSLHILPKGFTRSRAYGGYYGRKREQYLETCRQLMGQSDSTQQLDEMPDGMPNEMPDENSDTSRPGKSGPSCPRCNIEMTCIGRQSRPSWKDIFFGGSAGDCARYQSDPVNWNRPPPGG